MKGFFPGLVVSLFLLAGCEPASVASSPTVSVQPATGVGLVKDRVIFPDGVEVVFNGRIFQYQLQQNASGEFDRYIIHSADSLMGTEGAVFMSLAKAGYTRRIRTEVPGRFVVNYLKKGAATIVAAYSDHASKIAGDKTKARAIFTWKIAG